jgi:hypothetical protein
MQFVGLQRTADLARFILPFGERQNQCTRPVAIIPLTDIAWVHRTDTLNPVLRDNASNWQA